MKKKLAWALVLCLMMQLLPGTALPALAAQAEPATMHAVSGPPAEESAEEDIEDAKDTAEEPEEDTGDAKGTAEELVKDAEKKVLRNTEEKAENTTGILEVKVTSALPIETMSRVKVTVTDGADVKKGEALHVGGDGVSADTARFEQLPAGKYVVTVSAEKFADYAQEVTVKEDRISRIQVYSARIHTGSDAHPGWIMLGDVNQDTVIDAEDREILLSTIHEGGYEERADLNSDKTVDLMDLQYLVQSLGEKNRLSTVEELLPAVPAVPAGTRVEGELDAVLKDGAAVSLHTTGGVISEANPVGLEFSLAEDGGEAPVMGGITIQAPVEQADGNVVSDITEGSIILTYVDESGREGEYMIPITTDSGDASARGKAKAARSRVKAAALNVQRSGLGGARVIVDEDGSLNVDFGTQVAVKKVSIRITGTTKKQASLVEIAKVEFVGDMASRIPAPELDIPQILTVEAGHETLTVTWSRETNVTGYELSISGPVKGQTAKEEQIVRVADTTHRFTSINEKKLKNYGEYTIRVRSVNGDWTSPWSASQKAIPKPQSLPAPPDNVTAEGGYASITVKWKAMDDAGGYMVYYRKKGEDTFLPAVNGFVENDEGDKRIEKNSYTITGLATGTEYEICVKSWNELGWGEKSLTVLAATETGVPPILPKYNLINVSNGTGELTAHVTDATIGGVYGAKMVSSPLDEGKEKSGLGLVDDNFESYWIVENWDDGAANAGSLANGMTVTLDQEYEMSYLIFGAVDQKTGMNMVRVRYWNEESGPDAKNQQTVLANLLEKRDANDNKYYIVRFVHPIRANKVHIRLGRDWMDYSAMKVGEIHFHAYDELERDIDAIYADDTHITLHPDVTEETIVGLEQRLEEKDPATGERHPLYSELKLDLQTARELLSENLQPAYPVKAAINARQDKNLGFTGLNPWQPLGKTAYAGETVQVMVGHPTKQNGQRAELQLVVTQHHAESTSVSRTINLNVGKNEITIPQLTKNDFERGGQLYIAYTGGDVNDNYTVRVNGGSDIPVLDLYKKTGQERTDAIKKYVEELQMYQREIESRHNSLHNQETGASVAYDYDEKNCILNATDILMDQMMYSLPATQVWNSIRGTTAEEKAEALDTALQAMEDTMTLFYQHKGLSDQAGSARGSNAMPAQHLNIRYMRMFAGAFMYAAGNHIGVEWDSATLTGAADWDGFGWGIAHEIGHNINQGSYAIAEITNNYFAQLLTKEKKGTRFQYPDVYEKVTSGTVGRASSEAVQLALYWQLHLAFDNNLNDRAIYDTYEEQWDNLFFARVDTYARNPGKAPKGTLTLGSDVDQNLMRLACAAAEKNILPFFERWGMTPDAATKEYAALYGEADTKAIYYVNDDARDYRVKHLEEEETLRLAGKDVANARTEVKDNRVTVTITPKSGVNTETVLGYEIIRTITGNGEKESRPVGFVEAGTDGSAVFTDTVTSVNNRVMQYEVRPVDQFLNYAAAAPAGSVKIETDGVLSKTGWTVETNMISDDDVYVDHTEDDPDGGYHTDPSKAEHEKLKTINRIIDNNISGDDAIYTGKKNADLPQITVDMHKMEEVTALKYMGSNSGKLTVEVSGDGQKWTVVSEKDTVAVSEDTYTTIWFDAVEEEARDSWIGTYDARYIRLTMPGTEEITINEIEICGPSGDNMEFMTADSQTPAVGILKEDYIYGTDAGNVIPEGSLVFMGTYKGNPAYNMVILYDAEGNIIGSREGDAEAGTEASVEAEQVILADVPQHGNLGEVSEGIWVYYLEPGKWSEEDVRGLTVRGELYRVDNALTLEGERVVSDTLPLTIPETLPSVTITALR